MTQASHPDRGAESSSGCHPGTGARRRSTSPQKASVGHRRWTRGDRSSVGRWRCTGRALRTTSPHSGSHRARRWSRGTHWSLTCRSSTGARRRDTSRLAGTDRDYGPRRGTGSSWSYRIFSSLFVPGRSRAIRSPSRWSANGSGPEKTGASPDREDCGEGVQHSGLGSDRTNLCR